MKKNIQRIGAVGNVAAVDTETTGLYPALGHEPWEIAIGLLEPDGGWRRFAFHPTPNLTTADPTALRMNRFYERTSAPDWGFEEPRYVAAQVAKALAGVDSVALRKRRGTDVAAIATSLCVPTACLGRTERGRPVHPLYVPYEARLVPYGPGRLEDLRLPKDRATAE